LNKITLKYELDLDFILIAITSPLKDYRLCYFINKMAGLNLSKIDDHEVWVGASVGRCYFSRYASFSEVSDTEFYLLSNRGSEAGILIPEMRNVDYFMLIRNFIDDEDLAFIQERIASIPDVLVATEISPEKLKSKENLIF